MKVKFIKDKKLMDGKEVVFLEMLESYINIKDQKLNTSLLIAENYLNKFGIVKASLMIGKERFEFLNGKFI